MPEQSTQPTAPVSRSPGIGPSLKAKEQVRQGLQRNVQFPGQMPIRYQKLVAIDLYKRFLTLMPGWKGLIANGYGSSGTNVQISVSVDFGAFILPGLMELSAEAYTGASRADSAIVSIHRSMPKDLSPNPYAKPYWESSNPICLMALFGKRVSFQAGAKATVGLIQELPEMPQDQAQEAVTQIFRLTEIPLAIGVGAEAGAGYQYDMLYARDPLPGWYPSAMDQGLEEDFNRVLMPSSRTTKQEIRAWINIFKRQIYPLNDTTLRLLRENPKELYIQILNKQLDLLQRRKISGGSRIKKIWKRVRQKVNITFSSTAFVVQQIAEWVANFEARIDTTEGLQNFVNNLKYLIPPDDFIDKCSFDESVLPTEIELIKDVFHGLSKQLDDFGKRLIASQENLQIPSKSDSYIRFPRLGSVDEFNCFLKIASHAAEGSASVQAQAIGAYGRAGVSGSYKKTAYRYQTFTPSNREPQALIYTQDTSITYRQAEVRAGGGVVAFGREVTKELPIRGMTYQSACVYWRYPIQVTAGSLWVQAEKGSGLSYGVSISKDDLIACVQELQAHLTGSSPLPDSMPSSITSYRMIRLLANYLRLSVPHLIGFLLRRNADFLRKSIKTPAVLLEANYAFPADTSFVIDPKVKLNQVNNNVSIYRMQSLWESRPSANPYPPLFTRLNSADSKAREGLCDQYLQAIRIRARMADYRESEISFKLGIPIAVAEAAITLSKIEMAGQEGVLDIEQDYWTTASYDDCVPPVVIFHQ